MLHDETTAGGKPPAGGELSKTGSQNQDDDSAGGSPKSKRVHRQEDYLDRLEKLAGLTLMGIVPIGRANVAKGCYQVILNALKEKTVFGAKASCDENLLRTLKEQPELLNLFKERLTDEQLELVLREFKDD